MTSHNIKCFSLTSFWETLEYDNKILPLLRQISQLEKLTLSLLACGRNSFIDGTQLINDIISKMLCLNSFIFDIITQGVILEEELLSTSDDVRCALIQKGYNVGCYIDYLYNTFGRYHIYSLPFAMKRIQEIPQ